MCRGCSPSFAPWICGREKFDNLSVAQTVAARVSVIVIRHDVRNAPCYHLLTDSASALYVWDCVVDAMAEFGGTIGTP